MVFVLFCFVFKMHHHTTQAVWLGTHSVDEVSLKFTQIYLLLPQSTGLKGVHVHTLLRDFKSPENSSYSGVVNACGPNIWKTKAAVSPEV